MSYLVIVESPTKVGTIKSYLGSGYKVIASKGHIRDLPKSVLGVDIESGFIPHYINIRGKGDLIKELRKEAKSVDAVYFATDPDREGEAISWHLSAVLGIPAESIKRITINEITKKAVRAAIKSPGKIDMNLVNAQQTRRILDRIVGYKISPYLWKSIKNGLSAGRVQSVATRIIVDRENEIRAFVASEYWTVEAQLVTSDERKANLSAHFYGTKDKKINLSTEEDADAVLSAVSNKPFYASRVKKSIRYKSPAPPFTTSTMQQEASKRLGFQSSKIMKIAQELYEGINVGSEYGGTQGLITYMRTDSLRISEDAQLAALALIEEKYGKNYCPQTPRVYKSKANAQDAHEAIRPSRVDLEPSKIQKSLTSDQFKLYKLIWERFVASQMASATLNAVGMDFECSGYIFKSSGYTITFRGYMMVYNDNYTDNENNEDSRSEKNIKLPEIEENTALNAESIDKTQHFTEPPPRYNEASLIKFLEENGIGRPSTITPTITTIISRNYVRREGKTLVPTELGEITTRLMYDNFPDIINYRFTADMENRLDDIEHGNASMEDVLSSFWIEFKKELDSAEKLIESGKYTIPHVETDMICDKCGSRMIIKEGRYGQFAACPNYPTCKTTRPLPVYSASIKGENEETPIHPDQTKLICEKCGSDMVLKTGKYGSFYACSKYPTCKNTKQKTVDTGIACPQCGGKILVKTKGKIVFYSCENYPECKFSSWDSPTDTKCPQCGKLLFKKKGKGNVIYCHDKNCGFSMKIPDEFSESNVAEDIQESNEN